MSLVINWENIPQATGYSVYWSENKFTMATLPVNPISIPAGVNECELLNVKRQTVYWIVIETLTAGGNSVFGQIFPLGYFPDTGPGPTTLMRGTWEFGLFGEVPSSEIGNYSDIYAALISAGVTAPINGTSQQPGGITYVKCIVAGKIIFMPTVCITGFQFQGNSVNYEKFGAGAGFDDTTAPAINLKGRDYQHRLPRASVSRSTIDLLILDTLSDDVLKSEVGMMASLYLSPAETQISKNAENRDNPPLFLRLGDYLNFASIFTLHRQVNYKDTAQYASAYTVNTNGTITSRIWSNGGTINYLPVLELLF